METVLLTPEELKQAIKNSEQVDKNSFVVSCWYNPLL
jgi:hypothetical protein